MEKDEIIAIVKQSVREQVQLLVPEITQRLLAMHMQKWNRVYEDRLLSIEGWQTQFANTMNSLLDEVKVLNSLQWKCDQIRTSLVVKALHDKTQPFRGSEQPSDEPDPDSAARREDESTNGDKEVDKQSGTSGMDAAASTSKHARTTPKRGRTT